METTNMITKRPILYGFQLDVGSLRQYGTCWARTPADAVAAAARRYSATWLASELRAIVTVREVGSRRVRPDLVQEVRA